MLVRAFDGKSQAVLRVKENRGLGVGNLHILHPYRTLGSAIQVRLSEFVLILARTVHCQRGGQREHYGRERSMSTMWIEAV
jgi:hypothetical protein